MKNLLFSLGAVILLISSCTKEEIKHDFTVTIENVMTEKSYFQSGTLDAIPPGMSLSFSFNAGPGHFLQFVSMYAQSNDIFIAPDDNGINLYNVDGEPLSGDITSMIDLWDAGTEMNEEPGIGMNQAPRQSGPNTGIDENGVVALLSEVNDGFDYAPVSELVKVMINHTGDTEFELMIENISEGSILPSPFAPGVWAIHSMDQYPVFQEGQTSSVDFERLAEDGNNALLGEVLDEESGYVSPFAPGAYIIGDNGALFVTGENSSQALENLAEDGNPDGFEYIFNTPDGQTGAGPLLPGSSYSFTMNAEDMQNLSFALMLVHSNDWFIGLESTNLFEGEVPLTGDITSLLKLYDAGTEVDEFPGSGINQPVRQSGPNTGQEENGIVTEEVALPPGFPTVPEMIKVTIQ